jgi:hypothetical protein
VAPATRHAVTATTPGVSVVYELDWHTVLFVGYGEERALDDDGSRLERASRQAFVKLSYAWQL